MNNPFFNINDTLFILLFASTIYFVISLYSPRKLNTNIITIPEILFASLLLISYFMPWYSYISFFGKNSISGSEIQTLIHEIIPSDNFFLKISFVFYSIPIFSFATIILSFMKNIKLANYTSRLASIIPIFILIIILINWFGKSSNSDNEFIYFTSFGFYLMLLSGVGLWFSALFSSKNGNKVNSISPKDVVSKIEEKNILFEQLEKLNKLKENGILNEELYQIEHSLLIDKLKYFNSNIEKNSFKNITTEKSDGFEMNKIENIQTTEEIVLEEEVNKIRKTENDLFEKKVIHIVKILGVLFLCFILFRVIQQILK